MAYDPLKKKIFAIVTLGLGSWLIVIELREIIRDYLNASSFWVIATGIVLIWIGITNKV